MKTKDFYDVLGQITRTARVKWYFVYLEKEPPHYKPSRRETIQARTDWIHNPVTIVAMAWLLKLFDRSQTMKAMAALRINKRSATRIHAALTQRPGYSKPVRRKLLRACGLNVGRA